MDDFKGKFCNSTPFPVIRALGDCLRVQETTTTTQRTTEILSTTTEEIENYYIDLNSNTANCGRALFNSYAQIISKFFIIIFLYF